MTPRKPGTHAAARARQNTLARRAVAAATKRFTGAGIVSIHWGARYRRGRRTSQPCVVVFVTAKRPATQLNASRLLPPSIAVRFRNKTRHIPIDVQAVGGAGTRHVSRLEAGLDARVNLDTPSSAPNGTLSALLTSLDRRRAVLSGHVAQTTGRSVWGTGPDGQPISLGRVDKVINDSTMDVAWTSDPAPESDALGFAIATARDPEESDVNTEVLVLVPWDFRGIPAFIVGVNAQAVFVSGGADVTMTGLTALTGGITNPGDSGAPVVDSNRELIGFVLGIQGGRTFIVPARRAFDALENS